MSLVWGYPPGNYPPETVPDVCCPRKVRQQLQGLLFGRSVGKVYKASRSLRFKGLGFRVNLKSLRGVTWGAI